MQRLLITGGTGYLGAELVRQALAAGLDIAASYFSREPAGAGARWLRLEIRDAQAVERALAELRPDLVIHTAYRQSGPDLWSTSAEGAGVVARAAHAVGARLIHMSSDALFDGERQGSYTEADDPSPVTPYGEAKAAAERLVAEAHPAALIVRTSLLYGGAEPGQHERLVLDTLDGGPQITFFTDELRCPIAVGDLAAALIELAPLGLSGRLHVAGADVVSRYEFARLVAAAHGRDPGRLRGGLSAESSVRRPRNCTIDSSSAQRLIHTRLRGVYEVLGPIP
ncbi:MAG: SDR family oxidoreductase [Kouleothrix sp.]|nr:SDR family oxidoreductase [Kouleothrix sp.]